MVWKGQRALPFRCGASDGDAVGGGPRPRGDRTQISETPQAMESLHKCALRGAGYFGLWAVADGKALSPLSPAERLARIKRRAAPDECLRDKGLMSKWIDGNR